MSKAKRANRVQQDRRRGKDRRAERALRESEAKFRRSFELAGSGLAHVSLDGRFLLVNARLCEILGYSEAELIGRTAKEISHPEDREAVAAPRGRVLAGEVDSARLEKRYLRKDGSVVWMSVVIAMERDAAGQPLYAVSVLDDITDRKRAEAALYESEERFRRTFELAGSGLAHVGLDGRFLRVNPRLCEILGYSERELIGRVVKDLSHPEDHDLADAARDRVVAGEIDSARLEKRYLRKDGAVVWLGVVIAMERDAAGRALYAISVLDDITDRKRAEAALRQSEERFRATFELAASGIAHVDLEGRFVRVNRSLCEILGYAEHELIGFPVKQVSHPEDRDLADSNRFQVRSGERPSVRFEKRYVRKDASVVWVNHAIALARDAEGVPQHEIAVFDDITERKHAEAALREAHAELKRSNAELEQFAYVASHDLQEPLRMVSSYTQLLMRRYGERLDSDAKEFMHFIVDGAARMKQLIEDLLAYSKVGTRGKNFKPVQVEAALGRAVTNLRAAIEEADAAVTLDPLPTLQADEVLLAQLFQNLIGNALKFRGAAAPKVHVECSNSDAAWHFAVRDNGIGIEPQYFERIFMLFQRLHTKGDYPGTGIGLAICKKVVERHGGRIWVESRPGEGSAFHFTLPKDGEETHGE